MADERDDDEASLELPSLGFRRKRNKKRAEPADEPEVQALAEPAPEPVPGPTKSEEPAPADAGAGRRKAVRPSLRGRLTGGGDPTDHGADGTDGTSAGNGDAPAEGGAHRVGVPAAAPASASAGAAGATSTETQPRGTTTTDERTDAGAAAQETTDTERGGGRRRARGRAMPSLPHLPEMLAVVLTGVLVGLLADVLTFASLQGCSAVRGTATCGGPGLLLLVVILVVMVLAGTALLKAFSVTDPGSTSVLAVGLLTVITLLFFIDALLSTWMAFVIPLIGALAYPLARWVTTQLVDLDDGSAHR